MYDTKLHDWTCAPARRAWTAEMVSQLAGLWVAGHTSSTMAKVLGVSRSSVVGKLKSLQVRSSRVARLPQA